MRRLTVPALFLLIAAVPAQKQVQPEAPLLVRQNLVSPTTLQRIASPSLGITGYVNAAQWLYGDVYVLEQTTIDAASGEALEIAGDGLRLRADKVERWNVKLAEVGVAGSTCDQRLLFRERVVVPRAAGGLLGLARADGAVVWQRGELPNTLLAADGALLAAAGLVKNEKGEPKPFLAVLALANGAPSCRVELAEMPTRVVPGPQGIALVAPGSVAVRDRTGPLLFGKPIAVADLVAAPDGWFVRIGATVERWSRTGDVVWTAACTCADYEQQRLATTNAGDPVVATYMRMADSGFSLRCFAAADGALRWTHADQGLGVAHSKYWHHVQLRAIGGTVVVTSQAAGGNFAVRIDADDGSTLVRQKLEF